MDAKSIIVEIDTQIETLLQVRALLAESLVVMKRRGRPAGPKIKAAVTAPRKSRDGRSLSPEARQKIGEAQKKRWAAKKAA